MGFRVDEEAIKEQGRRRLEFNEADYGRRLKHAAVTVDHHAAGKMVPVKDQRSCGSCWAFASNSALEGTLAVKRGTAPVHLSEQQLVDCTNNNPNYRTYGCSGGWMLPAWKYQRDFGAVLASEYPYTARNGSCLTSRKNKIGGVVRSYSSIN
jgi:C1A family cysteine protease